MREELRLSIERDGEDYRLLASAAQDEAPAGVELPGEQLERLREQARAGAEEPAGSAVQSLVAHRLHELVFAGDVQAALERALERSSSPEAGRELRIVVNLSKAPELRELPWERLYDAALHGRAAVIVEPARADAGSASRSADAAPGPRRAPTPPPPRDLAERPPAWLEGGTPDTAGRAPHDRPPAWVGGSEGAGTPTAAGRSAPTRPAGGRRAGGRQRAREPLAPRLLESRLLAAIRDRAGSAPRPHIRGWRRRPRAASTTGGSQRRARWASTLVALAVAAAAVINSLATGSHPRRSRSTASAPGRSATPATNLPAVPAGWPAALTLGVNDSADDPAAVARKFGAGTLLSEVLAGDPLARQDWSQAGGQPARAEASELHRYGLLPVFTYYVLLQLGRGGRASDLDARGALAALRSKAAMTAYWRNVTELLRELGADGRPAVVEVDPPMWALVISATGGRDPQSIPATVAPAGVRGMPATLAGVARAWVALRNRYAPKVMLGYPIEDYAFADPIDRAHPTPTAVGALARRQAGWYRRLGATFDLSVYELDIRDFGHDRAVVPLRRDFAATADYLRDYVRASGTRVLMAHIPAGNTLMRPMNNTPFHWRDNHPQLMLGDPGHAYLRTLRDAGVIGLEFGAAGNPPDVTCPCDAARDGVTNPPPLTGHERRATSADDDGGYLAQQIVRYERGPPLLVR